MTDDLPNVPPQHEVSRAASRWVEGLLPPSWVVHKPSEGDDYGVDLRIEIVENRAITGRQVVAQVKGTADSEEVTRVRIKATTLNYLRELADPAVVIRACPDSRQLRVISADDPRLDVEDGTWTKLAEEDEIAPEQLAEVLNRFSCRRVIEKGRAPLVVGLDNDVAVRRTTLMFEGRLDGVFAFDTHSASPWQQYSARYVESDKVIRLQDLLPPRQHLDIPIMASMSEMITAHVSFLWVMGLGRLGARMLLRAAPLIGNKLVNVNHLVACAATYLTHEECTTILRVSISKGNSWTAQWMTIFMKSGIGLHVTKDEVDTAFALQEQQAPFPMLHLRKAQVLLSIAEIEAASVAADVALRSNDERTPVFYYELSDILARSDRIEDCVKLLDEARTKAAKPQLFGLEQAKYLIMLERYDEAREVLARIEEPKSDPLQSLYRLSTWLATFATPANQDNADTKLKNAWQETREAFMQRGDAKAWAKAAISLELLDGPGEDPTSSALFLYSAIYFGGDVVRLVLEHPVAESFTEATTKRLSELAITLDAWRGGMVALTANDGELETIKVIPTPDK